MAGIRSVHLLRLKPYLKVLRKDFVSDSIPSLISFWVDAFGPSALRLEGGLLELREPFDELVPVCADCLEVNFVCREMLLAHTSRSVTDGTINRQGLDLGIFGNLVGHFARQHVTKLCASALTILSIWRSLL